MLNINKKYNSSKEIVKKYNLIQFSKNTDLVFKKIDSIEEIKEVYREDTSIKYITKEACLKFALSSTRTIGDAARLLGIRESDLRKEIKKFKINLTTTNYDD